MERVPRVPFCSNYDKIVAEIGHRIIHGCREIGCLIRLNCIFLSAIAQSIHFL